MCSMIVPYILIAMLCVSNVSQVKSDLIKGVLLGAMIARQKGSEKVIVIPMYHNPHLNYETTTAGETSTSTTTSTTTTTEAPTTTTTPPHMHEDYDEHDDNHLVVMPVMPMINSYYQRSSTSTSTLPTIVTTSVPTTRAPRKHWGMNYW